MRKENTWILFFLALVIVSCSSFVERDEGSNALVTRIIDGDTFVLDNDARVRLLCIDTPERGRPYYSESTEALRQLIENKTVILEKDVSETDRYGRLLRYVYVDDVFVNERLVREGYAIVARYPPDIDRCDELEQAQVIAQHNGAGLWGNLSNTR